jgi:hypothetical protein
LRALLALLLLLSFPAAMDGIPTSAEDTRPLKVGSRAPDAVLRTVDGADVRLRDVLAGRLVALVFYRGGW